MRYKVTIVKIYDGPTRIEALEAFEREYPRQGGYVAAIEEYPRGDGDQDAGVITWADGAPKP